MLEFNVAPNTQIGRILIPEKVYENENKYLIPEEKYSRGGEFIENMMTDNYIEFCHRWFGLANFEEILDDIEEYMNQYGYGSYKELSYNHSPILPISEYSENNYEPHTLIRDAIHFYDEEQRPIIEKE